MRGVFSTKILISIYHIIGKSLFSTKPNPYDVWM